MYAVGAGLSSFFAVFLHHLFKQKGGRRRCVGNGIGRWEAYGDYENGSSYGRRGTHYVRGLQTPVIVIFFADALTS